MPPPPGSLRLEVYPFAKTTTRNPCDLQKFISLDDFQQGAKQVLPKALYEYLASGTEDEQTLHENRLAFKRILLRPRVMRNLRGLDISVSLLNGRCRSRMPVLISPAGSIITLSMPIHTASAFKDWSTRNNQMTDPCMHAGVHCLVDPEGEVTTARAAMNQGIVMGYSQHSTRTIEDVAEAAKASPNYQPSLLWYQLYILKDRRLTEQLVQRAEAAGFGAIVLTVDSIRFGFREADW